MPFLKKGIICLLFFLFFFPKTQAAQPIRVVAATPDLADIAKQVGGTLVEVESLCLPKQNPHFVEPKPSLIVKLMSADVFIENGLELEVGWAPLLIQGSRNKDIQPGGRGFLDASTAIAPMEVPQNPNRSMGDVHPGGNPHYLTDPENGRLVARLIAQKFTELDHANKNHYDANLNQFEKGLTQNMEVWNSLLKPYKGEKFISYHRVWPYFAARFGLVSLGEIEPKPGIPPTASHTNDLIERMKAEKARLIFVEPWYEKRTPRLIADKTKAALLPMALLPGAAPQTDTYISAISYNVKTVADALKRKGEIQ